MKDMFALAGFVAICGGIIMFGWIFIEYLIDVCRKVVYRYKRNHRFDRKPIAKCYCKDCIYYIGGEYPGCRLNDRKYVEDDFFCKKAEPYKHDPDKNKNK